MNASPKLRFNCSGPAFVCEAAMSAHGPAGDPESSTAPAVVLWFEIRRESGGKASFIPHLIDDDSGVGTQVATADLNGDGRPDVIVGNKKGIFVHLNQIATAGGATR